MTTDASAAGRGHGQLRAGALLRERAACAVAAGGPRCPLAHRPQLRQPRRFRCPLLAGRVAPAPASARWGWLAPTRKRTRRRAGMLPLLLIAAALAYLMFRPKRHAVRRRVALRSRRRFHPPASSGMRRRSRRPACAIGAARGGACACRSQSRAMRRRRCAVPPMSTRPPLCRVRAEGAVLRYKRRRPQPASGGEAFGGPPGSVSAGRGRLAAPRALAGARI